MSPDDNLDCLSEGVFTVVPASEYEAEISHKAIIVLFIL